MKLTKLGHACVRLTRDGGTLVVDPGTFSEANAVDGADAVLITHEHFDHVSPEQLAGRKVDIYTGASVAAQLTDVTGTVHIVGEGDSFTAAGFDVVVYGRRHAVIHPDIPVIENTGFLIGGSVFHPGDSFTVPGVPVQTLLSPVYAPWLKISEAVDHMRAVNPARVFPIHDGLLNDAGHALVDRLMGGFAEHGGIEYRRTEPGETVNLG
ncbi:MBL fold metallo-hydrolase [Rhizohabitans arisaemae]|uniref:MBL fold metallo-hydrolase n=1 Tax=Rhizohabitans arisaemae TaxID=2720610 RepID=UPI0024B0D468|nr:MBL fold metallo-hydrolase [Rhizohabitans arisaemae]